MKNSSSQRLSFGRQVKSQPAPVHSQQRHRVSSRVASKHSRQSQQFIPVHGRRLLQSSGLSFMVLSACKASFKVVPGPVWPVSCCSLSQGGLGHRFASCGEWSKPAFRRPVFGLLVRSQRSGHRRRQAATSGFAVLRHFHRCASSSIRRPNPSVKGTGLRPAPYVER